jgi:hypothetical protein
MGVSPQHVTLTAATVSTVTLSTDFDRIEVLNVTGTAAIYFTVDGSTPVSAADGTFVVPAALQALEVPAINNAAGNIVVKLISSGTPGASVRGVQ